jgi:thiamine biosynthesis lipoprotein
MGVPFRIVLYAPDKEHAQAAAKAAFDRVAELNEIMSDYETNSELSVLSASAGQGKAVKLSPELWLVLSRAQALAEESGGAFDITVGPYVSLWRKARRERKLPDPAKLEAARAAVGYQKLHLNPKDHTAELMVPGMRLDLGGIGKGYALDEAMAVLNSKSLGRALISGGGDLLVGDPPPGKRGWRIELPPLDASNAPPARFVELRNAALSTSGDLYQRLEIEGKRYSHLVDPHTGIGLTDHSLVTVIAPDGITADSLTKVASILPWERALKLCERRTGVAVRVVRKPGQEVEVHESSRFKKFETGRDVK